MRFQTSAQAIILTPRLGFMASILVAGLLTDLSASPPQEQTADSNKQPTVSLVFESSHATLPVGGSEIFLRARVKAGKSTSASRC